MSSTILITGASGLIGRSLSKFLVNAGHRVKHLGRYKPGRGGVEEYTWNISKNEIEAGALEGTDVIIHLAGASLAKGRWTEERKQEIIRSRVQSMRLLQETCEKQNIRPKQFIGASAIGYYGTKHTGHPFTEDDPAGKDFMAEVCREWEEAADAWMAMQTEVTLFRIGLVLSASGGALPLLAAPVRWFAGAPIGSGKQVMSWIHIQDMVRMISFCMEKNYTGVYNAVAPQPMSNKAFTKAIAKQLHRPVWPLPLPGFVLRMIMGEQADMVLEGVEISSKKIQGKGFAFTYPTAEEALKNLLA